MGGERASKVRMREIGKICYSCGCFLALPYPGRERACLACMETRRPHAVTLRFASGQRDANGYIWHLRFVHDDGNTTLGRMYHTASLAGLRALILRTRPAPEALAAFDQAASSGGEGKITLHLSADQFRRISSNTS